MIIEFKLSPEDFDTIRGIVQEEITKALHKRAPKYYTRKEAASMLKISLPTLHVWVNQGKIKYKKVGNRVLFDESELELKNAVR